MPNPLTTTLYARRAALRLVGVAAIGTAGFAAAACGDEDAPAAPEQPDPLLAQADRARTDAALATAAIAAQPDLAAALGVVAAERTAHADALATEVARAAAVTSSPSSTVGAPSTVAPPAVDELRTRIADSATSAAQLARTLSGYRAGLLGSISAACAVQRAVLLP